MNKSEIKTQAKWLVAHNGPMNVLEFGEELVAGYPSWNAEEAAAIQLEAMIQADRVLDFLKL